MDYQPAEVCKKCDVLQTSRLLLTDGLEVRLGLGLRLSLIPHPAPSPPLLSTSSPPSVPGTEPT